MIKHFCDMCSKQVNMNVDGVSVLFNAQGIAVRNSVNEDLHLCLDCNKKLKAFIHSSAENKQKKDGEAQMNFTVKSTLYMHFSNTNSIS